MVFPVLILHSKHTDIVGTLWILLFAEHAPVFALERFYTLSVVVAVIWRDASITERKNYLYTRIVTLQGSYLVCTCIAFSGGASTTHKRLLFRHTTTLNVQKRFWGSFGFKKPPLESAGAIHPFGCIMGLSLDSIQRKTHECIHILKTCIDISIFVWLQNYSIMYNESSWSFSMLSLLIHSVPVVVGIALVALGVGGKNVVIITGVVLIVLGLIIR